MTTTQNIREWIHNGKVGNYQWMIVVADMFDYEDYPVYVETEKEFDALYFKYDGQNMQKIMEVYDLQGDTDEQLKTHRNFSFPTNSKYNRNTNPVQDWLKPL